MAVVSVWIAVGKGPSRFTGDTLNGVRRPRLDHCEADLPEIYSSG